MSLSGTIDFLHSISSMSSGLEVDKSIIHARLGEAAHIGTIVIGIVLEVSVFVVVVTVAATKDITHTALLVFHIGRGRGDNRLCVALCILGVGRIINLIYYVGADTTHEVLCIQNTSTEVVTAKDIVTNPREATSVSKRSIVIYLTTNIGLSMS